MSVHWSSEVMKWEYRDLQATAMSVDWSGNIVLLAGRRCLALKRIGSEDDNTEIIKKYTRQSKYDAAGAEWCQTQQGQRLCAILSNQRVDVYHWRNEDLTCTNSLRGHTRVVSDTHWHRQDHNLLATCSIDTFTHIWDLRDTRKPALSLCAVAGASQVQWNKVASHILATAHDGDIKIWDKRKGSAPIHYISAHLCKIHGVDWSPHHEYQLVTSSHDGSIKYFDINNARRPETTINTNFPVWRAIYTPFGSGLLTIGVGWGGVPRGEQAGVVGVWVGGTLTHRFVGHADTILQMVWRPNTSPSNYQLITWARDQTLRIWSMPSALLKMCNHYLPEDSDSEDDALSETLSYTSATDSLNDMSANESSQEIQLVKLSSQKPSRSLDEEFESVRDMSNMVVTDMSMDARTCTIRTERNGHVANLQVSFPHSSSNSLIPKFSWLAGTTLDSPSTIKILQSINLVAHQKVRVGLPCLLQCLKTMGSCIDQIPVQSKDESASLKSVSKRSRSDSVCAGDACIPFPRTCGAKWCAVDTLVVFNRPPNARRMSLKQDCGTPRSMSSLAMIPGLFSGGFASVSPHATTTPSPTNPSGFSLLHHRHQSHSITTFYFQDRWKAGSRRSTSMRGRGGAAAGGHSVPRVVLYSATPLFLHNRSLAQQYVINNNTIAMCEHNGTVAAQWSRPDLMQAWQLGGAAAAALRQSLEPCSRRGGVSPDMGDEFLRQSPDASDGRASSDTHASLPTTFQTSEDDVEWKEHPFGSHLVQSLIMHYAKISDIQMAATLACAFPVFNETNVQSPITSESSSSSFGNNISTYTAVHQMNEMNMDGWAVPFVKQLSGAEADTESPWSPKCELSEATLHLYNGFKRTYADILHRWGLLDVRAEVMKQVVKKYCRSAAVHSGLELSSECVGCGVRRGGGAGCAGCGKLRLRCVVCGVGVRGLSSACVCCGHGGHAPHLAQWFSKHQQCPSGCGCMCLVESSALWKGYKFS